MAVLNVPVTKSKGTVAIETDNLPEDVYREALLQGLKVLVNRAMSKITKETYPDADQLKAAAQAKADENVADILAGKIRFTSGTKAKKASGAVMTEARRLARNVVKDEMKKAGIKISHVEASEITRAANELLADEALGKELIDKATANLEERSKVPVAEGLIKSIKISDKKVQAAEAKKAKAKTTLSATQAGKPKARAKQAPAPAQ